MSDDLKKDIMNAKAESLGNPNGTYNGQEPMKKSASTDFGEADVLKYSNDPASSTNLKKLYEDCISLNKGKNQTKNKE